MTKAKYKGCDDMHVQWGGCDDPRKVLELGKEYEIDYLKMHSQHTKVKLLDIVGMFPSSAFDINDETLWRQARREWKERKRIPLC